MVRGESGSGRYAFVSMRRCGAKYVILDSHQHICFFLTYPLRALVYATSSKSRISVLTADRLLYSKASRANVGCHPEEQKEFDFVTKSTLDSS